MNRRVIVALSSLSIALMGCSTLDTQTAAQVGDAQLSDDELFERLGVDGDNPELVDAQAARAAIESWIGEQLAAYDGDGDGDDPFAAIVEAGPFESGISCVNVVGALADATSTSLLDDLNAGGEWADAVSVSVSEIGTDIPNLGYQGCVPSVALFSGVEAQVDGLSYDDPYRKITIPDGLTFLVRLTPTAEVPQEERQAIAAAADFEGRYDAGPEQSGVVCSEHILVASAEEADEVVQLLDDGASFAEVAMARSVDTGSGANGGSLGCQDLATFNSTFIPEFTEAALAAEIGVPTAPVESQFGFHIIRLPSFDGVGLLELAAAVPTSPFAAIPDDVDIEVSPTYGYFDPVAGVVPLG